MAERDKAMPYYRWWVQDYRGSRNVQRLTWQERGMYRELIDECWDKGGIPDDCDALAEIIGCERWEIDAAWSNLRKLFVEADGHLVSPRLEKERTAEDRNRLLKQASGRKGGLAKASNARMLDSDATKRLASSSEQFRAEQSSSGASVVGPLGGLTPALCPWCGTENGHTPDCRPTRIRPEERTNA